jgi:hypothetical protein
MSTLIMPWNGLIIAALAFVRRCKSDAQRRAPLQPHQPRVPQRHPHRVILRGSHHCGIDGRRARPDNRGMRYPRDRSPDERAALVQAVRSAVADINRNDNCDVEIQVAAFLCAAWPTVDAQNQ